VTAPDPRARLAGQKLDRTSKRLPRRLCALHTTGTCDDRSHCFLGELESEDLQTGVFPRRDRVAAHEDVPVSSLPDARQILIAVDEVRTVRPGPKPALCFSAGPQQDAGDLRWELGEGLRAQPRRVVPGLSNGASSLLAA
jgi:hypothetical protein